MKRPLNDQLSMRLLSSMMDQRETSLAQWTANDLQAILTHQLATLLEQEKDALAAAGSRTETDVMEILTRAPQKCFRDALIVPGAPRELLLLIKDFAKTALADGLGLPDEVARVLYVLAIRRADAQGSAPITSLDPEAVVRETRRCLTANWLPDPVREALRAPHPD